MADVPSKEELDDKVDEIYHREFEEAPKQLHPTSAEHAPWREIWLTVRDRVVNEEVNRIYWDTFPNAPIKIDPHNRAHDEFKDGWLDIRDRLMANQPQAPLGAHDDPDDAAADISHVRAGIYESLADLQRITPADLHQALDESAQYGIFEVMDAIKAGLPRSTGWIGAEVHLESEGDLPVKVHVKPYVWIGDDGAIEASLVYGVSEPGGEVE